MGREEKEYCFEHPNLIPVEDFQARAVWDKLLLLRDICKWSLLGLFFMGALLVWGPKQGS